MCPIILCLLCYPSVPVIFWLAISCFCCPPFSICSRKLQPLVDYVLSLGRILEKRNVVDAMESETSQLARRLKKILVDLNEYDNARSIARTFHLKEALWIWLAFSYPMYMISQKFQRACSWIKHSSEIKPLTLNTKSACELCTTIAYGHSELLRHLSPTIKR